MSAFLAQCSEMIAFISKRPPSNCTCRGWFAVHKQTLMKWMYPVIVMHKHDAVELEFTQLFSFFLPDWWYNHTGKHRSSILYLCWSWLVNVQPARRCTARTSWPHAHVWSSLIWTGNLWQAVQFYFKFPNEIFYVKQPQRLHFSSCAALGRVAGFPAELRQQLGLNIVQMFTSHRAGSESVLWLLQLYLWQIKIFQLPCEISQRALDGLSVHTSWLTGWVMLALVSLRGWNIKCQEKNES